MPTETDINVSREVSRELAPLVSIGSVRKRNRWRGPGVIQCLAELGIVSQPRKLTLYRNKVLGLGTVLAVVALAWGAVGFAFWHFLR